MTHTRLIGFIELIIFCVIWQATFCGSAVGKTRNAHFSMKDFESMGYHMCDTLLDYCDPDKTKVFTFKVLMKPQTSQTKTMNAV